MAVHSVFDKYRNVDNRCGLCCCRHLRYRMFTACCLADGSRYLIIDDKKIDLPRGADINGKTVFKRTVAAIDGISSIECVLYKGDRIVSKDTRFYSLKMKDGSIITFTLYAYGKKAEEEIISTLKKYLKYETDCLCM